MIAPAAFALAAVSAEHDALDAIQEAAETAILRGAILRHLMQREAAPARREDKRPWRVRSRQPDWTLAE